MLTKMIHQHIHIIILFFYLIINQSTSCLRVAKENTHLKQKCFKNITSSTHRQESHFYPSSKCITLSQPYCLGLRLPYNSILVPDHLPDINFKTFEDLNSYLDRWNGAKKLPRCWPNIQVALCALFMPQCDEDPQTGRAVRYVKPSADICNDLVNREECRYVGRQMDGWPTLFNCSDMNLFARNCSNDLRELKYSSPASQPNCQYPLVPSNDESTWFKDIGGCSLHCKFPISSPNDLANVTPLIKVLYSTGLTCTLYALIMFTAGKIVSNDVPRLTKVIRRCTVCYFLVYVGWSLQLLYNSDIACNPNGSSLYGMPLVANSCVLSFILTYLPSLSALLWLAHLGQLYLNLLTKKDDTQLGDPGVKRAWSLFNYGIPLTLFVSVAFLGHIDGHGLYGICTVGQQSIIIKTIFVLMPTILCTIYGNYFFMRIIIKLALVERAKMEPNTRANFIRIMALAVLTLIQAIFTTFNYFYEHANKEKWLDSVDDYVACQMDLRNVDTPSPMLDFGNHHECNISAKPIVTFYYLEIISTLSLGVVVSSWTFNKSYNHAFRRKLITFLEVKDKDVRKIRPEGGSTANYETRPLRPSGLALQNYPAFDIEDPQVEHPDDISINFDSGACDPRPDFDATNNTTHRLSLATPMSLDSVSLQQFNLGRLNSENSSLAQGPIGHVIRQKGKFNKQNRGPTSRDIVNDCKQRQNEMSNVPQLNSMLDNARKIMALQLICQSFNPPDLPPEPPRFEHGVYSGTKADTDEKKLEE